MNGTGWQMLGWNLPHRPCAGLVINYKANKIRAGISGRGVWEHDLWCPSEPDWVESGTYTSDAFKEALNDITSAALVPIGLNVAYRGGGQVHLLPGFHAAQGSDFHAFIHPCDRVGNSFKSMPGGAAPSAQETYTVRDVQHTPITVQPNPNQGNFSVRLPEASLAVKEVRLLSLNGSTVPISWRPTSTSLEISTRSGMEGGVYMMRLLMEDESSHIMKVLIQP